MLTQAQVEEELGRLIRAADECAHDLAEAANVAAHAEHAWKLKHAKALLSCTGTVAEREASALVSCAEEHEKHLYAKAQLLAVQETGRMIRASMDALRSVNATVRHAVSDF